MTCYRPIFGPLLMYTSREERLRAATLRKLLVEANLDYEKLQGAWNKNKLEGIHFSKLIKLVYLRF